VLRSPWTSATVLIIVIIIGATAVLATVLAAVAIPWSMEPLNQPTASNAPGDVEPPHGDVRSVSPPNQAPPGDVKCSTPQEKSLSRISELWKGQATTEKVGSPRVAGARELACLFRSSLQSETVLVGQSVLTDWVREHYPIFCRALHVAAVPFKDFAAELGEVMPKRRHSKWKAGRRLGTHRYYRVPDPTGAMVKLAAKRRRA
jgi:hypothetical protein